MIYVDLKCCLLLCNGAMFSCACVTVVAKCFVQSRKLRLDLGPLNGELQGFGGNIPVP